jgi:hypothetical protein
MERESRFIKTGECTYKMIEAPGVKMTWDFDFTIIGEKNGMYKLALIPHPGTIFVNVDQEMLNKLEEDIENFFLEKGAVRFSDIFKHVQIG